MLNKMHCELSFFLYHIFTAAACRAACSHHNVKISVCLCFYVVPSIWPLIGPKWKCYMVEEVIEGDELDEWKYLLQQENKTNDKRLSWAVPHLDLTFADTNTDGDIEHNIDPILNTIFNPILNQILNPILSPILNPTLNPILNPMLNPILNLVMNPMMDQILNPILIPIWNPILNQILNQT